MRWPSPTAVGTALLAGIAGVAGSFLVAGPTRGFVGFATGSVLARYTPGAIITATITGMGNQASTLAFAGALALAVGAYALLALLAIRIGNRPGTASRAALLAGGGIGLLTVVVTGGLPSALGAGIPAAIVIAFAGSGRAFLDSEFDPERRRVGVLAAGVLGFGTVSYLANRGSRRIEREPLDLSESERRDVEEKLQLARDRSLDIGGSTGLVSEHDDFYHVDINSVDPKPDPETWELEVTGEVENGFTLDGDGLRSRDPVHRFVTLRCVGERLNGRKLDTALWTGIPVDSIVGEASPTSNCGCVMVHSVDGYYVQFPIEAFRRGLLAYGMNGLDLPVAHGRPVRLLVPGHWGEVSVKWISKLEFLDRELKGYWERKGWHGTGPVKTVAKLHHVNRLDGARVRIGGHAYAGYRGISGVQVSTDGGRSWEEATLSEPLPDEATWRQWVHEIEVGEPTEVTVRAVESDGTIQPREETDPFPNGPGGWVTRSIEP